jgi:3-methyladenine DNA glycosylase/8-oxoguanine DNA glycosylase
VAGAAEAITQHSDVRWYVRRDMAASLAPLPAFDYRAALDDLAARLGWYRHGRHDPTTRVGPTGMLRAMWTPDGPASIAMSWATGALDVEAWGPGASWAAAASHRMAALDRRPPAVPDLHPVVTAAARRYPGLWAGASGDLYHTLLPTILAQRITSGEAIRQWSRLCHELGERPPGPGLGLVLPPHPDRLAGRPTWWFHPLGIEGKRARALAEVARVAHRLWDWARLPVADVAGKLRLVRGIGPWTIGSALGPVCGDDDAVPVGDYHLPSMVSWNLAGEPRGTDDRMLDLLEPFRGQRGRVLRLLVRAGRRPPAFGPRRRILPMHRW